MTYTQRISVQNNTTYHCNAYLRHMMRILEKYAQRYVNSDILLYSEYNR